MMLKAEHVMGIILAGGQGRRMGFVDKPLISLGAGVQGAHGAGAALAGAGQAGACRKELQAPSDRARGQAALGVRPPPLSVY